MYRNFVPAEFTFLTKQTFCDQFKHALDLLTEIDQLKEKNEPDKADKDAVKNKTSELINILVDDWEYRWREIINCDKIPITEISRVIECLGLLSRGNIEITNKDYNIEFLKKIYRGCRQSQIKTVKKVFDMVKRLSLPKRVAWNEDLIQQNEDLIQQKRLLIEEKESTRRLDNDSHLRYIKQIESVEKALKKAEAKWFGELNSKSFDQMALSSDDLQIKARIEEARQLYLNEFGGDVDQELGCCIAAQNYQQNYYDLIVENYDLIVEKLPSLGVLLSQSQKIYYEIIRKRSFVLKDLEENTTEIEKLNTNIQQLASEIQQLASEIHILQLKGSSLFNEFLRMGI